MLRFIVTGCLLACGATVALAASAQLEKGTMPSGPAKAAVERWFTAGRDVTCSGGDAVGGACDLGRTLGVRSFYDAGGLRAVVFIAYSPDIGNGTGLAVGQFRRDAQGWSLVRTLMGIYGEGPDALSFDEGRAVFSMNALMPGDARCCLTGKQRYEVDLATGSVTAGPKTAGAKAAVEPTPASGAGTFAPRPEGYEGATYLHNGSVVMVDERAGVIRYATPKASIRKAVSEGAVLFRGTFTARGKVSGTAFVFKAGCKPAAYPVSGASKGSTITLKGQAPRRDPRSCAVTGLSDRGAHTVLTFQEYGGDF